MRSGFTIPPVQASHVRSGDEWHGIYVSSVNTQSHTQQEEAYLGIRIHSRCLHCGSVGTASFD